MTPSTPFGKVVKKEIGLKPNEHREIIQISAYKIQNYKVIDTLNIYVKPNINKKLSKYITNLTGITNNKINKYGLSFKKAIETFYNFSKFIIYILTEMIGKF